MSAVSVSPAFFDSSGSIRWTGSGLVNSGCRMRVPVTTIAFLSTTAVLPVDGTSVCGGVWAACF